MQIVDIEIYFFTLIQFHSIYTLVGHSVPVPGWISVPGMRENPAVLRFEELLLDEVLLV